MLEHHIEEEQEMLKNAAAVLSKEQLNAPGKQMEEKKLKLMEKAA